MSDETKMGGKDVLTIAFKGDDLIDLFLSKASGGNKLQRGILELVAERFGGHFRVEITQEPAGNAASIRSELEDAASSGSSGLLDRRPDLVVFGLRADVLGVDGQGLAPLLDFESYLTDMEAAIRLLKELAGAHVIAVNGSTVDPAGPVRNYHQLSSDPPALRIHKLDLALIELSYRQGISIIDVDRVLAEMGAALHVRGALDYSPEACEAICLEFLRVLEEYGFFEERPLLLQVGQER